jgi:hypothetical protein
MLIVRNYENQKTAAKVRRIPIVSKIDPSVPERLSLKLDTYFLLKKIRSILISVHLSENPG